MKRIILVTTLLFLILIAAVVNGWALSVQGHVADETNKDVKYKQVYIGDYDGQTDGNGNFVIWIDPGKYIVSVDGYKKILIGGKDKSDQTINFRPGQDRYLNISVEN